jgi:hypothetical protein
MYDADILYFLVLFEQDKKYERKQCRKSEMISLIEMR